MRASPGSGHGSERKLDLGQEVSPLVIAQERFGARSGIFDGSAKLARGPQHETEFDIGTISRSEVAADIMGKDPQPIRRNPEHRGEFVFLADGAAASGVERISLCTRIVMRQRRPRLQRNRGHASDAKVHPDNMSRASEGAIASACITEHGVYKDIVRHLVPDRWSTACERCF